MAWGKDKNNPNWKGGKIIKICPICGKGFKIFNYRKETARYCSRKCRIISTIGNCGYWLGKTRWSMVGERNRAWRGDKVGYVALHDWVKRWKGKPKICEHCGKAIGKIEWANKSGEYKRDLSDWISLCVPCHRIYDKKIIGNPSKKLWKFGHT